MVVVVTTEICRNVDWLCESFRIIKCVVHIVENVKTNNVVNVYEILIES